MKIITKKTTTKKVKAPKVTHTNIQRDNTEEHVDGKSYGDMLREVLDSSNMELIVKVYLDNVYVTQINSASSNSPLFVDDTQNVLKDSVSIIDPNSTMVNTIDVYYKTDSGVKHVTQKNMDACLLYTSPSPRDGLLSRMPSSA